MNDRPTELQHNPPNMPLASDLQLKAVGAVESAFQNRSMAEGVGNQALDNNRALTDLIGLNLRATIDQRYPGRSAETRMNATDRPDGQTLLQVRTGDGTGVDITVDRSSQVRITPVQSLPGGTDVREPATTLRWATDHADPKIGFLEKALPGGDHTIQWVSAGNNGGTPGAPGFSGAMNGAMEGGGLSAIASGPPAIGRLLDRDAANGVRASRNGTDLTLPRNFQQDGQVLYNGLTVVQQAIRTPAETVTYNKQDLLDRAKDPGHLDRLLEQGGQQRIVMAHGSADALPLDRPDQQERALHR